MSPRIPAPPLDGQWRNALATAFGLAFLAGALVIAASGLWWAVVQWRQALGRPLSAGLPAVVGHALFMVFGFFPMFFAGFILTAGARWMRLAPVPPGKVLPAVVLHLAGCGSLAWALLHGDAATAAGLVAAALALIAASWTLCMSRLVALIRAASTDDLLHPKLLLACGVVGGLAMGCSAAAALTGDWGFVLAVAKAAAWGFVGPVFLVSAHRMVPFFSNAPMRGWEKGWYAALPGSVLLVFAVHTLSAFFSGVDRWQAAIDLAVGALLLCLALYWARVQSLRSRMLLMLYAGFVWLGLSFVASGAQWFLAAAPSGFAPLHAFTMGFLGSTMLAMLSRVAAGQAGRWVVVDRSLWTLFVLLQIAAAARVAAALAPGLSDWAVQGWVAMAATAWALVWVWWAVRYGRLLALADRPHGARADR